MVIGNIFFRILTSWLNLRLLRARLLAISFSVCYILTQIPNSYAQTTSTLIDGCGFDQNGQRIPPTDVLLGTYGAADKCNPCWYEEYLCPPIAIASNDATATLEVCPNPDTLLDGNPCERSSTHCCNTSKDPFCKEPPATCQNKVCTRSCPSTAQPTPPPSGGGSGSLPKTPVKVPPPVLAIPPITWPGLPKEPRIIGAPPPPATVLPPSSDPGDGGSVDDGSASFENKCDPVFDLHPQDIVTGLGRAVSFYVSLKPGCAADLKWVFRPDAQANATWLENVTGNVLYFSSVSSAHVGKYYVVAVPRNGRPVASREARLTLDPSKNVKRAPAGALDDSSFSRELPQISQQPSSIYCELDDTFALSADVNQDAGTYSFAWERRLANQNKFEEIPGATSKDLSSQICRPGSVGSFRLKVSNQVGSVYSRVVQVYISSDQRLRISKQPVSNQVASLNSSVRLGATVRGGQGIIRYQWQYRKDPSNTFVDIAGANTPELVLQRFSVIHQGYYRIVVSDQSDQWDYSGPALVSLSASDSLRVGPPEIVDGPYSVSGPLGSSTTLRVLSAGSSPQTYRWLLNGKEVATTSLGIYSFKLSESNIGEYQVEIRNALGQTSSATILASIVDGLPFKIMLDDLEIATPSDASLVKPIMASSSASFDPPLVGSFTVQNFADSPIGIELSTSDGYSIRIPDYDDKSNPIFDLSVRSVAINPFRSVNFYVVADSQHADMGSFNLRVNGTRYTFPVKVMNIDGIK